MDFMVPFRWKTIKLSHQWYFHAYGGYIVLSLLLAWLLPDNVLSLLPWLAAYFVDPVARLASFLWPINAWAELSAFPEVARLTLAVLCVVYPWATLRYCRVYRILDHLKQLKSLVGLLFGLYIVTAIVLYYPWILIRVYTEFLNGIVKYDLFSFIFRKIAIFAMTSRLGFGVVAVVLLTLTSSCLGVLLVLQRYALSKGRH